MTPPADHPTPPHIELLDPPSVRPFEHQLQDVAARWKADVARQSTERTVFTDQRLSIEASAARD